MQKPLTIGLVTAALAAGAMSFLKVDGGSHAPAAVVGEAAAAEEAAPTVVRMAQLAVSQPYIFDYERGPRIIQVPQRGDGAQDRGQDRGVVRSVSRPAPRASVERRPEPAVIEEDDDDEEIYVAPAPKPRPRTVTPKPRAAAPAEPRAVAAPAEPPPPPQPPAAITPRWKLRSETPPPPPPTGPRRAVLSAPPPSSLGPTPLRPTPNFDNKAADRGEKFSPPREPAASPPVEPSIVTESQPPLGYSPPATPATPVTPADEPSADVTSAAPSAEPSPEN